MSGTKAISRYEIQAELARGGMGSVYRVLDREVGELRVMKRALTEPDTVDPQFAVEALEREYAVLASLKHPSIVVVHEYGVDERGPYYTMEYLAGQDLREAAPLPFKRACGYLRHVAASLALLHARRLVHRDLSPGNVRIVSDSACKLLDFGTLVPFGRSAAVVGTPPTIAPEAFQGGVLDQRTDLYSFGTLAYWLLTRRHAYPALEIRELPMHWRQAPAPPSAYVAEIPPELDALVLALVCADPLARPGSAAEVIARLEVIGELPPEEPAHAERLAQSFLQNPRFSGRAAELALLDGHIAALQTGRGAAVRIEAAAGLGRTRLLEEVALQAQLAGAIALRVDASAHRQAHGVARALARQLFAAAPELCLEHGPGFRASLGLLGEDLALRFEPARAPHGTPPSGRTPASRSSPQSLRGPASRRGPASSSAPASGGMPAAVAGSADNGPLDGWFMKMSQSRALVIEVDNVEQADDPSLGLLFSLAQQAAQHPLLLIVSERQSVEQRQALGLIGLRQHASSMKLKPLDRGELLELLVSMFGDAPNLERFATWLYGRSAGGPLYAIEICRQLLARQAIRYTGGFWTLPQDRYEATVPTALADALRQRVLRLSEGALSLAECLSLQQEALTFPLCCALARSSDEASVRELLAELAENDILHLDAAGFRFSSSAISEALHAQMDDLRLAQNHRRLGLVLAERSVGDAAQQIQAGWHLIRGGEEAQGADLIASVAADAITPRVLAANLHKVGQPFEAALLAYTRHRRSVYLRLPLLCALAQAGYYESAHFAERYGDQALDALEEASGLGAARRLRPWVGRWLALVLGIVGALLRFCLTPRGERSYSFDKIFVQLFGTVSTLTGTAALSIDPVRAGRVAAVLEPFAMLPARSTPAGIYLFCRCLEQLGGENVGQAYQLSTTLLERFSNPRYYPTLPADARRLYVAGAHFARATCGLIRVNDPNVLASADALDATGLELYAMIASELRYLYYMLRGEFEKAGPFRQKVDLHAARMGSVWQVEPCDAAFMMGIYVNILSDIVASARLVDRLGALCRQLPMLERYRRMAVHGLMLSKGEPSYADRVARSYEALPERGYLGWSPTMGHLARGFNILGEHARAKGICERILANVTASELDYFFLFLGVEIELAIADAGLGHFELALARIDVGLNRFRDCDHPLLMGLLHEARARICWSAGDRTGFADSLLQVERWFRPTGMAGLIAKHERLRELAVDRRIGPGAPRGGAQTEIRGRVVEITESRTVRT